MSLARRFELPNIHDCDVDQTACETCPHQNYNFTCEDIGYCITDCGENYVICSILQSKGYVQANIDWAWINGLFYEGIELYKTDAKKFIENMKALGYGSTLYHHPLQKNYLCTVIIDNHRPIELAHILTKLDVIK
jgi:hypothetical protein